MPSSIIYHENPEIFRNIDLMVLKKECEGPEVIMRELFRIRNTLGDLLIFYLVEAFPIILDFL